MRFLYKLLCLFISGIFVLIPFNTDIIQLLQPIVKEEVIEEIKIVEPIALKEIPTFRGNISTNILSTDFIPAPLYELHVDDSAFLKYFVNLSDTSFREKQTVFDEIPQIYKYYIDELKSIHPDWVFEFFDTGLTWESAVSGQNVLGRNAVSAGRPISYRSQTLGYEKITESHKGYVLSHEITQADGKNIIKTDDGFGADMSDLPGYSHKPVFVVPNGSTVNILKTVMNDDKEEKSCWCLVEYKKEYYDYKPIEGKSWFQASESYISYCMDPRNFLNESGIFQFESLSFDIASPCKIEDIEALLKGSFMENTVITDDNDNEMTYAEAFILAGEIYDINPYHLVSRVLQEVTPSGCATTFGCSSEYPGIYNFYNIGANSGYLDGLRWACQGDGENEKYHRPWTSQFRSILGGAAFISEEYIGRGQNTLYFEKFAVTDGYGASGHQYMSNIDAPSSEAKTVYEGYLQNELLDRPHTFIIPIYTGLPE